MTVKNSYGNTVYRCVCGFEAWGAAVNYHESATQHGSMQAIGRHEYDRDSRTWIWRPAEARREAHVG